jgi:hypothetical protein
LFEPKLADRLQQPKPRLPTDRRGGAQQALVQERLEVVDHRGGRNDGAVARSLLRAHRRGGFQREPANEERQPAEHRLLVPVEQAIAPGDCRAQGLMAHRRVAGTAGQQLQALLQARVERREWE